MVTVARLAFRDCRCNFRRAQTARPPSLQSCALFTMRDRINDPHGFLD
jgi:hypothetical protein